MENFNISDYRPSTYSAPDEYHIFNINDRSYGAYRNVYDKESKMFEALDYAANFLETLQEYYKKLLNIELPSVRLYIVTDDSVNAFAKYEESLGSFCIGLFKGACDVIYENVMSSFEGLIGEGKLIPEEKRNARLDRLFIEAIRFLTAHEYAHIVCGHVTKDEHEFEIEFLEGGKTEEENLLQQMKEFQADQEAMIFQCSMAYWDAETRRGLANKDYELKTFAYYDKAVPGKLGKKLANSDIGYFKKYMDRMFDENVHDELQLIMGGVNVVFYTLDSRRRAAMKNWAIKQHISKEEQETFYFKSGLSTIRKIDHPLPAIRIDAVIRIIDEAIESGHDKETADAWSKDVSDYAWLVEINRNEFDLGNLYLHIAHTPTAQDFIQEMNLMWEQNKNSFVSYVPPLKYLFYFNRIVDMTDDGKLIH